MPQGFTPEMLNDPKALARYNTPVNSGTLHSVALVAEQPALDRVSDAAETIELHPQSATWIIDRLSAACDA